MLLSDAATKAISNALPSQNIHHAIHRVALADSAGVQFHSGAVEPYRPGGRVQMNVPVTYFGEGGRYLRPAGQAAGALVEPPKLHQRAHRDIESPFALPAVCGASREQLEQLRRHLDGFFGRVTVDFAPLAFGPVIGKHAVEPPHLVESGVRRRLHLCPVVPIKDNGIRRAHGVAGFLDPQQFRPVRRQGPRQEQNHHELFELAATGTRSPGRGARTGTMGEVTVQAFFCAARIFSRTAL